MLCLGLIGLYHPPMIFFEFIHSFMINRIITKSILFLNLHFTSSTQTRGFHTPSHIFFGLYDPSSALSETKQRFTITPTRTLGVSKLNFCFAELRKLEKEKKYQIARKLVKDAT